MTSDLSMTVVADIGATNLRIATIGKDGRVVNEARYATSDFGGPIDAIEAYCLKTNRPKPRKVSLAVAAPVCGDIIDFTNNGWRFSASAVKQKLELDEFVVLNDAIAWAISINSLPQKELTFIGPTSDGRGVSKCFVIPGTGLGLSALTLVENAWIPLPCEGAYVELSGNTDFERLVLDRIRQRHGRASAERVLSGSGFVEIFEAVKEIEGHTLTTPASEEITRQALSGDCEVSDRTVRTYLGFLGELAGTYALMVGATSGVFLAGNICRAIADLVPGSEFRDRFESKGRASSYLAAIPSAIAATDVDAFVGCSLALELGGTTGGFVRV